jgi:hypothetical protein
MRDDQQMQNIQGPGPAMDGHLRRTDEKAPARRFARRVDCGDLTDEAARRGSWPAARAIGAPREGGGVSTPGAA